MKSIGIAGCFLLAGCMAADVVDGAPPRQGWVSSPLPAEAPFRDEIAAFDALDRATPPPPCPILFVGSSSIRMWSGLAADMAPLPVLNRGFGGSSTHHVNLYFDRLVTRYGPRAIVVYAGDNDVDSGAAPAEAIAEFQRFMALKRERLGATPVFYISIKPSRARFTQFARQSEVNDAIETLARAREDLTFIDVRPAMLSGGTPRDLFLADGLHMTSEGYAIWREHVMRALQKQKIERRKCGT